MTEQDYSQTCRGSFGTGSASTVFPIDAAATRMTAERAWMLVLANIVHVSSSSVEIGEEVVEMDER